MAVVTIRALNGSTSTQSVVGAVGAVLTLSGPAQTYTLTNTSTGSAPALLGPGDPPLASTASQTGTFTGRPDFYKGLYLLENASGPDGNRWYRWIEDQLMDVTQVPPTSYVIGVE